MKFKGHNPPLIALDIATVLGYATPDCSGSYNLTKDNRETNLYWFLHDLYAAYEMEVIAVERAAGQHKNSLIVMAHLRGVVNLFAKHHDIKVVEFSPGTIKKFFTGNGRASKEEMMEEFMSWTCRIPVDDNEADAYALFQLAKRDQYGLYD